VKNPRSCQERGNCAGFLRLVGQTAVCGRHFVLGQAAKSWDKYNVDWVPTLKKEGTRKEQQEPFSVNIQIKIYLFIIQCGT